MLQRLRARHLKMLEVLSRSGTMRDAAGEMAVTQPAITKMLQDLEDILEVKLFDRRSTGLTPTPVGLAVIEFSRKTVSDLERFAGLVTNLKLGGYGSLKIGAIMASMQTFVPRALQLLKAKRPLMTINLLHATSDRLLEELANHTIDLAVARLTDSRPNAIFDFEPLLEEEIWIFGRSDHLFRDREHIALSELFDQPWVLQPPGSPLQLLLQRSFADAGMGALPNWIETSSVYATLQLVRHAGMIAALPQTTVEEPVANGEFVRLSVPLTRMLDDYGLVTLRDQVPNENTKLFAQILRESARDTTHEGPPA